MTPQAIIRGAAADGVALAISPTGNIRAKGAREAVNRWTYVVRQHKPELLDVLRQAQRHHNAPAFDRDTFEERAAIVEHDGGLSRDEAERLATIGQGYTLAQARRWLN